MSVKTKRPTNHRGSPESLLIIAVAGSGHDPQFAGIHMAMAIMKMLPQMEVENDIFIPLFVRGAVRRVKNIPG
jgi:hypothetical protein